MVCVFWLTPSMALETKRNVIGEGLVVPADGFDAIIERIEDLFLIGGGAGDLLEHVGDAVVVEVVALELFADDLERFGLRARILGNGAALGEVLENAEELIVPLRLAVEIGLDGGHQIRQRNEAFLELGQRGVALGPGFEVGGDRDRFIFQRRAGDGGGGFEPVGDAGEDGLVGHRWTPV